MLQNIRNTAGSWVVKVLFVLLILSFGAWGVNGMFHGRDTSNVAITVGPTTVTLEQIDQEFRRTVDRLRPMFGGQLTNEQARQYGLLEKAVEGLTRQSLYDLAAADDGIAVGNELIAQMIAQEPSFRNDKGQFDPYIFKMALQNVGYSEATYAEALRHDIARSLTGRIAAQGAFAPEVLVEALYRQHGEQRVADVATFDNAAIGDVGVPDDAAIKGYYDDHAVTYTAPEYRALTIARLSADDLAATLTVDDAEVRALYQERLDSFREPERRSFKMAMLSDDAKAKAVLDDAKETGLDAAAKKAGVDVVKMDKVVKTDVPELGDSVFALENNEVGGPYHTSLGWYVIEITGIESDVVKPFEAVKDTLEKDARHDKALDLISGITNKVEDGLAAGSSLEEVAAANGLKIEKLAAVDATGKDPAGKDASKAADLQTILKSAFVQAPGQTGELIESGEGQSYIARVDQITPPALRPLETVRDQVVAAWQGEERERRATAKADALAADLRAKGPSADFKAMAEAAGATVTVTDPFNREAAAVKGLPPLMKTQIFATKPDEVITGTGDNAEVVARVAKVIPVDPKAADAKLDPVRNEVLRGISTDIEDEFAAALQATYKVTIYQDRIDTRFSQSNP